MRFGLIFLFLLQTTLLFSQWDLVYKYQGPSIDLRFIDIEAPNEDTVYILSREPSWSVSRCYYTFDGGISWDSTFISSDTVTDIDFPTTTVGYATAPWGQVHQAEFGPGYFGFITLGGTGYPDTLTGAKFFTGARGLVVTHDSAYYTNDSGSTWQSSASIYGDDIAHDGALLHATYNHHHCHMIDTAAGSFGQWEQILTWIMASKITDCDVRSLDGAFAASCIGIQGIDFGYGHQDYGLLHLDGTPGAGLIAFPTTVALNDVELRGNDIYVASTPYPGNDHHVMKSTDGGLTFGSQWFNEPGGISVDRIQEICMVNDSVGYAVGKTSIYKTSNGGGTINTSVLNAPYGPPTSIVESGKEDILVYPNPATTELNIIAPAPGMNCRLMIINVTGGVVKEARVDGSCRQLDVDDLPNGVYTLKVWMGNNHWNTKLVISR